MNCEQSTIFQEQRNSFGSKLLKSSNFKNRFISLWEKHGTFFYEEEEKYFDSYRIDGDGEGAIEMSRLIGKPDLHKELSNRKISSVTLKLNFSKSLALENHEIQDFKDAYVESMKSYFFDSLYYLIELDSVRDAYFVKEGSRIEDAFLDELAWELAERDRVGRGGRFPYDVTTYSFVSSIEYNRAVSHEAIEELMKHLYDDFGYNTGEGEDETPDYMLPSIWEKVHEYAYENKYGKNVLEDLFYVDRVFTGEYALSVDASKRMNPIFFLKVIEKSLDFKSKMKKSYFFKRALMAIAVFAVAALLAATGNVAAAASLLLSFGSSVTGSRELKILSYAVSLYSFSSLDGLLEISYSEAGELIMNVTGLYYSLRLEDNRLPTHTEDNETTQKLLYAVPYDTYSYVHCYKELISVDVKT